MTEKILINDEPIKIALSDLYCVRCRVGFTYERAKTIKDNKCPKCNRELIKKLRK